MRIIEKSEQNASNKEFEFRIVCGQTSYYNNEHETLRKCLVTDFKANITLGKGFGVVGFVKKYNTQVYSMQFLQFLNHDSTMVRDILSQTPSIHAVHSYG